MFEHAENGLCNDVFRVAEDGTIADSRNAKRSRSIELREVRAEKSGDALKGSVCKVSWRS